MTNRSPSDFLKVLADPASTLSETMQAVEGVEATGQGLRQVTIGLSSNVTVELLGLFLRKHALLHGVRLEVVAGNHDDPIGDAERFASLGVDYLLLLPFFDNLLPSFESQLGHLPAAAVAAKGQELRARYRVALEKAASIRQVLLGGLHRYTNPVGPGGDSVADAIVGFDAILRAEAEGIPNVQTFDMAAIIGEIGRSRAFDARFYYGGKAPYAAPAYDGIARRVTAVTRGFGSYFYKALVLDCDNTLWGGVIGEDLLDGIKLDPYDSPGSVFWRVQNDIAALEQSGVLVCLCTKNNPADVEEVFATHPNTVLRDRHFVVKKVNWDDKVANLEAIARQLNIGLDSLVFVDDSAFECDAVRSRLPMVRTFQVPAKLSSYPAMFEEIKSLFIAGGISAESRSKTEQYRQRASAEDARSAYQSNDEYLASLGLTVKLSRDAAANVKRISELTLKSNQFNLTTRRYGEGDIKALMTDAAVTVYSLAVSDKFGDAGITGVVIVRWQGEDAVVDSFLMSCRVIGRGIEFALWNSVLGDASRRRCSALVAGYLPTAKNGQVADFYDRLGMPLVDVDAQGARRYRVPIATFTPPHTPWIETIDGQ